MLAMLHSVSRSLPFLILLALLVGCDSGTEPERQLLDGGIRISGAYTATIQYTADGSQGADEPTDGTGFFQFVVTSVEPDGSFMADGSASLTLGTHHSNTPNVPFTGTVSGSTLTITATSGVNLSMTGTAVLSSDGQTLTIASARIVSSSFVGLETGTTTSIEFTFLANA